MTRKFVIQGCPALSGLFLEIGHFIDVVHLLTPHCLRPCYISLLYLYVFTANRCDFVTSP